MPNKDKLTYSLLGRFSSVLQSELMFHLFIFIKFFFCTQII